MFYDSKFVFDDGRTDTHMTREYIIKLNLEIDILLRG